MQLQLLQPPVNSDPQPSYTPDAFGVACAFTDLSARERAAAIVLIGTRTVAEALFDVFDRK